MNGKKFAVLFVVLTSLALGLLAWTVVPTQASIEPVLVVDQVFTFLNLGDVKMATAFFAEDATARNEISRTSYQGQEEISEMLKGLYREGRRFEIVNVEMAGDVVTASAEVSDGGLVYGTQVVEAVIKDGFLHAFTIKAFRLELWKIGR